MKMMKLFTLLAVAIPVVHALPQAPLPSARFPANASLYASISSAVTSANLRLYVTPLSTNETKEWSALGDCFTSGIRPNGLDDHQGSSQACRRYDKAYPMQMNADGRWPGNAADRKLDFGACSGNTMQDVWSYQVGSQISD